MVIHKTPFDTTYSPWRFLNSVDSMKERESDKDEEIKEIVHGSKENETCEFSTTPVQKLDMESFRKERKKKKNND